MKDQRRTGSSRDFRSSTINCPLTPSNPFRITYIRKNAPANPYGSHIYKTKDLKSFRITYLQKKGGWRGPGHRCPARKRGSYRVSNSAFRISIVNFRLSTVDCQLSALSPLTSTLTKNASATPLTSTLTKTKDLKSFNINTYEKGVGGTPFSAQRNLPLQVTSHESGATNHGGSFTSLPSFASCLRKLVQRGFHFGTGVVVAFFLGDRDPAGKNLARFSGSSKLRQQLAEVEVARDVVGIGDKEFPEMLFGGGRVARVHTFHCQAVAGKGVSGFGGDELFEFLAARLGGLGHKSNGRIIAGCALNAKQAREFSQREFNAEGTEAQRI